MENSNKHKTSHLMFFSFLKKTLLKKLQKKICWNYPDSDTSSVFSFRVMISFSDGLLFWDRVLFYTPEGLELTV